MQAWEHSIDQALSEATGIVDVRSPAEYAKGHIAGAESIPLFSNGERAEIGTLYRMLGREQAIDKGLDFLGARLSAFVRDFERFRRGRLLVYCARGGMRSAAVVGLLGALGYDVQQLPGGYKAFRNYLLGALERRLPPRVVVIHGRTGVGKTQLLHRLDNALDLEDIAQHRSSVFGAINLQPRTQQQFDAHLLDALGRLDYGRPVWVEGESRRIGDVLMPEALRRRMVDAPCVLVTAPMGVRVQRIVDEYAGDDAGTRRQWEAALTALKAFFGRARSEDLIGRVWTGDFAPVVETLLREWYDPRYDHAMQDYRYALSVDGTDLDAAAADLAEFAAREGPRLFAGAAPPEAAEPPPPATDKAPLHAGAGSP